MIPFAMLFVTAVLTGWQLLYRIMMAIWGAPNYWLHFVSFFGSLVILGAAYVSVWSRRTGLRVAIVGLIATGASFVPALVISLISPPAHAVYRWYLFVPSVCLIVTTVYVLVGLRRPNESIWYPASAARASKVGILLFTIGAAVTSGWYLRSLGRQAPVSLPSISSYQLVERFANLPADSQQAFLAVFAEREAKQPPGLRRSATRRMLIAEPDEAFQATDIVEHGKPERRLIFAAIGEEPFVLYEHGGRGLHLHALFLKRNGSLFVVSRNLVFTHPTPDTLDTLSQLWRTLRSSARPANEGEV